MEYFTLIDAHGKPFVVESLSLYEQLKNGGFKLFGFDMPTILELRKQYMLRRGPLESSPETVKRAFETSA